MITYYANRLKNLKEDVEILREKLQNAVTKNDDIEADYLKEKIERLSEEIQDEELKPLELRLCEAYTKAQGGNAERIYKYGNIDYSMRKICHI